MFKKLITLSAAAALALSMAGSAFAAFADLELIRVYYERTTGTVELATDLGNVTTLIASGGTIPGSFGTVGTPANMFAAYFALDRATNMLWVSGSANIKPVAVGGPGYTTLKNGSTPVYSAYNAAATGINATLPQLNSAGSYVTKLSASQGSLGNAINIATRPNTEINLASLIDGSATTVTRTLYSLTGTLANSSGVAVATITTNSDGSTVISPPPMAAQTIGVISLAPPTLAVGATSTASAQASSGLAVTFGSTTPSVCSVSGTTVTGITAGTCTIAADQAGDAGYSAAPEVTQNITVDKGTPIITWANPADITYPTALSASQLNADSGGVAGTFSYTPASGAILSAGAAQTLTVNFVPTDSADYGTPAAATVAINVSPAAQSIVFDAPPTLSYGGATGALGATGGASGLPVTFTSLTPSVCSVSGSTVTPTSAGTCSVAADQAGNANFTAAARVTQDIVIGQGSHNYEVLKGDVLGDKLATFIGMLSDAAVHFTPEFFSRLDFQERKHSGEVFSEYLEADEHQIAQDLKMLAAEQLLILKTIARCFDEDFDSAQHFPMAIEDIAKAARLLYEKYPLALRPEFEAELRMRPGTTSSNR